ncbi:hypothetical protein CAQU_08565 [Corynebacterium aquilae DSM 44791]|uniref:Uncharacterized protein n=1 Tax=Corynebacterium aquilae DSM 44791 TaxID=1431546 RepID=A0A1L7CGX0_9CORY|nr:hypothetical protein CAQU_08565 [Corynebacterium aquilae DSM 44791]
MAISPVATSGWWEKSAITVTRSLPRAPSMKIGTNTMILNCQSGTICSWASKSSGAREAMRTKKVFSLRVSHKKRLATTSIWKNQYTVMPWSTRSPQAAKVRAPVDCIAVDAAADCTMSTLAHTR